LAAFSETCPNFIDADNSYPFEKYKLGLYADFKEECGYDTLISSLPVRFSEMIFSSQPTKKQKEKEREFDFFNFDICMIEYLYNVW